MFCPNCGAEYRDGFTRCSDCQLALVDALPQAWAKPDAYPPELPRMDFLLWFIPLSFIAAFLPFALLTSSHEKGFQPLVVLVVIVHTIVPLGAYWMIYQAIRYEPRVGRFVLLAFVPFMFVWYRLVRYPNRPKLLRIPREGGQSPPASS
jgi:hypothetical protein